MTFYYLDNQVEMDGLDHNSPITLAVADYWHLEGWYEGITY
jgi:hypothetical protein